MTLKNLRSLVEALGENINIVQGSVNIANACMTLLCKRSKTEKKSVCVQFAFETQTEESEQNVIAEERATVRKKKAYP